MYDTFLVIYAVFFPSCFFLFQVIVQTRFLTDVLHDCEQTLVRCSICNLLWNAFSLPELCTHLVSVHGFVIRCQAPQMRKPNMWKNMNMCGGVAFFNFPRSKNGEQNPVPPLFPSIRFHRTLIRKSHLLIFARLVLRRSTENGRL